MLLGLLAFFISCGLNSQEWTEAQAQSEPLSSVYSRVNPSVVEVVGIRHLQSGQGQAHKSLQGSGVIISEQGRVLTSAHVLDGADMIMVRFSSGRTVKAEVIASAGVADVALLQLHNLPGEVPAARLGDSDVVAVGDQILVIGAPYGIRHTLTVGYISGRRQSKTPCPGISPFEFLQTDAAINQGNSGGPMLDMQGRVIGIVSRILSRSGGSEGLGFAVGVNTAKRLLMDSQSMWVGFDAALISGPLARALNVPQESGLLVQSVAKNSPADQIGLQAGEVRVRLGSKELVIGGDIILSIQGRPVQASPETICEVGGIVGGFASQNHIEMTVLRGGETFRLRTGD
jgi:S1-C subfamily serine protease